MVAATILCQLWSHFLFSVVDICIPTKFHRRILTDDTACMSHKSIAEHTAHCKHACKSQNIAN